MDLRIRGARLYAAGVPFAVGSAVHTSTTGAGGRAA